jgi:hypothetical protein
VTTVHHVVVGDAERDPLLHVALGALACIARLDELLEHHAPPGKDDDHGDAHSGTSGPVPDDVAVVLGVLAVRARIMRALEPIAAPTEQRPAATVTRPGWLR